jgi:uncharacterized membrane protein YdjX (TVP38/TMEM64 family)
MTIRETPADAPPFAKPAFRWRWILYATAIVLVLAAARFLPFQDLINRTLDWIGALGPWAPITYVAVYIVAAVLLIPGSALTIGAGAAFGPVEGIFWASLAATLAATCAFLVGRYLARNAVARRMEGNPRFEAIDQAVAAEGWKIVLLMRLSPVFPYTFLNYAFGLTRVKLGHYFLASWIGMFPGTVMYVYLGSLAQVAGRERTPFEWGLYGVGFLATVAVTVFVTRIARRALARKPALDPEAHSGQKTKGTPSSSMRTRWVSPSRKAISPSQRGGSSIDSNESRNVP